MDLARVLLNDWQNDGDGTITTNDPTVSPQTIPALNSAIRTLYRKLRLVGGPTLIRDNVQIALPANALTGPGVQVYLGFNGFFDGVTLNPAPVLPNDLLFPEKLWEQQTGNGLPFVPMCQPQFGLPSRNQTFCLGEWEWRGGAQFTSGQGGGQDALWFVGALAPVTIRMRYLASFSPFSTGINFNTTYIPILDCEEAVAYTVAYIISAATSGITPGTNELKSMADMHLQDLRNEQIRRQQTIEYSRQPFVADIMQGYASANNLI